MNRNMRVEKLGLGTFLLSISAFVNSQSCENYGTQNGTSCSCPPGFGGQTCSQPSCGGDIFQGSQRPLAQTSSGSSFANLTSSSCTCSNDWTGTGCNVCNSPSSCQSAFNSAGGSSSSSTISGTSQNGQNNTITCNSSPRTYASGQLSCQVINPTLQAIYPRSASLNIMRTVDPSLSPMSNISSLGTQNSVSAQLFYDGVEQFFCKADSCTQSLNTTSSGSANWECQNLQCQCRNGTSMCGATPATDLTKTINTLSGALGIDCDSPENSTAGAKCSFKQSTLQSLFGQSGLALSGCVFGECVRQSVIDTNGTGASTTSSSSSGSSISGGVIAGLAVVGGLILLALMLLAIGLWSRRKARRAPSDEGLHKAVGVQWQDVSYVVPGSGRSFLPPLSGKRDVSDDKVILDDLSGYVRPGEMMAILGPSGAGKTTLVEKILAGRSADSSTKSGSVTFPAPSITSNSQRSPRIGFVPQQDVLPPTLTVYEALLFAARLRLPERISDPEKKQRVEDIMESLKIAHLRNVRIGAHASSGRKRGISGGETRRVSIGLELIASPDVLILDEPTSGLDSVSALVVARLLHSIAHNVERPIPVIASIHQPSSQLYRTFDSIVVLAHGRTIYNGAGGFAPVEHFASSREEGVPEFPQGYNVADYLLEIASDPPAHVFQSAKHQSLSHNQNGNSLGDGKDESSESNGNGDEKQHRISGSTTRKGGWTKGSGSCATTFLTQLAVLSGREWKILTRDRTLFFTHVGVASLLGVFCGGLYFQTDLTIAGFQSRVGCLFFLGALIAFSTLSALYNVVEIRPLFVRERSSSYYSPTAWLLSRVIFDVVPLRIVPTIIVSSITYWMAGLAPEAANFFKFLFILVLYTLVMTLFNFLLGTLFQNGGIAILLSALTALYQMTYAGFFVHINTMPPVLRWLQWLCPLKYTLEALSVNEVGSGLMIVDTLEGVPVNVSATLIMDLLFGFVQNSYYRDVLVLFAFIAGFGLGVIAVVWLKVREGR